MSAQRQLMPHRYAVDESLVWGPWMVKVGPEAPRLVEGLVDGWDYSTPIQFECQVQVDVDRFLESTGLDSLAPVDIVGTVDCSATLYRALVGVKASRVLRDDFLTLKIDVDPSRVAGTIDLGRHVVLSEPLTLSEDGRAHRLGSRLQADRRQRVLLEGAGGRFPTEAVPFSAIGREPAPWDLTIRYSDLHDTFMGAVRLVVNTEHPAGLAALNPDHPEHPVVVSVMRWDMVRRMLGHIVMTELDLTVLKEEYNPESVGGAVEALCELYLKRPLMDAVCDFQAGREDFEPMMQARLGLLEGVR